MYNLGKDKRYDPLDPDKVVFNYSNISLPNKLKFLLAKGLKYALPPSKINFAHYFLSFEKLLRALSKHSTNKAPESLHHVKSSIKNLAFSSYYSCGQHNFTSGITKDDLLLLNDLSKNKDIIVTRPDKGRGVVILDKNEYIEKMESILRDKTKFFQIEDDCTSLIIKREDQLNNMLRKLKDSHSIDKDTYSHLFTSGSKPGVLYGLPKVHKTGCPLRPILSAIGTLNYNISKYFVPILKTLTINEFTIHDTFSFVKTILDIPSADSYIMASFDVTNLFTNVPLTETIEIIIESLFNHNTHVNGLNKVQFKKLLEIATKDMTFFFDGKLYKQVDGVAMGSPLGPTLANIFMCFHEKRWLTNCPPDFRPSHYYRYVDDTFLLFKSQLQVQKFLQYMNSLHKNIKFTCELESNGKLPFLDVSITRDNNRFSTATYRKPTYTGLTTKFDSFIPIKYKTNLINTLINRAYKISKSYQIFTKEIDFITDTLRRNGFPLFVIQRSIRQTLNNIFVKREPVQLAAKDIIYINLPYIGPMSYTIRRKLLNLVNIHYSTVDLRILFTSTNTIGHYFKVKDKIPNLLCSSVIYKFTCSSCNAAYIGKTSRNLFIRADEHKGVSYRTGRPLGKPMNSPVREHCQQYNHSLSRHDFKIIDSSSFASDLSILESLWIWKGRPKLNEYLTSTDIELLRS